MSRWWIAALLALALLGSGWLFRQVESSLSGAGGGGHEPDFYMTDFHSVAMDVQGRPERELRAGRMVHFADTGAQELTAPRLCFRLTEPKPWCVTSESGWVAGDGQTVRLLGEVHERAVAAGCDRNAPAFAAIERQSGSHLSVVPSPSIPSSQGAQ